MYLVANLPDIRTETQNVDLLLLIENGKKEGRYDMK
jgi:hypothetical protein